MRHDPRLLLLDTYPHVRVMDLMYSDMDVQRHVNNVAITRLFEEARVSLHRTTASEEPGAFTSLVLARLEVHYLREVSYPGVVSVGIGTSGHGRTSFENVAGLFQDGACAALMWATMARRNDARTASQPLSAVERDQLDRYRITAA
ncbi:acyl-CoA thioesterase [Jatrophihabitans fulvus]